jgi:hypothetical protein
VESGYSNRETGKAPPKLPALGEPRRIQHYYSLLSEAKKMRMSQIRDLKERTLDEELIYELENASFSALGRLAEARDKTGQRLFIVVMGSRDYLTGVKVDAL